MTYNYTRETLKELGYKPCEDTQLSLTVETLLGYHLARKYRDAAIMQDETESERYWQGHCDAYRTMLHAITGERLETEWHGFEPYYTIGGVCYTFATCADDGGIVWFKRLF